MSAPGFTPIQLYFSTTAAATPSAGNLANGELAVNITDGRLFYKDNGGTVRVLAGTGGSGVVAGSNTQVQFNNNGVFGASANMVFNGTRLTVADLADSGLTSGRVTYASTGGALVDSANLTFDGTTLTPNALTVTNAVTLTAATANGVMYANGSKVLTTGSALTFDGTNLNVGFGGAGKIQVGTASSATYQTGFYGSNGVDTDFQIRFKTGITEFGTGTSTPLAFSYGGSEQMRLTSTGLGIGTSSPGTRLDVSGVIRGTFNSSSIGGATTHGFEFRNATTTTKALIGGYDSSTGAYIQAVNFGTAYENLVLQPNGGNLGLGVTPSAWNSTYNGFDIGGSSISGRTSTNNQLDLSSNGFRNAAGNWVYKFNGPAVRFTVDGSASGYQWYTAPSGTAGNAISFTQAMTLTAGGDLAIGTTASNGRLTVVGPGQTIVRVKGGAGTNQGSALYFENAGNTSTLAAFGDTASIFGGVSPDTSVTIFTGGGVPLVFAAGATERARIDSSGNLLVGSTTSVNSARLTVATGTARMGFSAYEGSNNNTINTIAINTGGGGGMCVISGVDFQSGASFSRLFIVAARVSGGTASSVSLVASTGTGSASFAWAESGGFLTVTASGFTGFGGGWTVMFMNN